MNNIKVALFINSKLGLQILKFLLSHPDVKIQFIAINEDRKRGNNYLEYLNECMLESKIRIPVIKNNDLKQEKLPPFDFGVSAMFGHIINDSLIEMASIDFINLHPSLLPIGRGANPISWSIIENKPQGATIHKLTSKLDSGEIYQQSEVKFGIDANASIVYKKLNEDLCDINNDLEQEDEDKINENNEMEMFANEDRNVLLLQK
jgi:methionyl-tRNA formyltransferase